MLLVCRSRILDAFSPLSSSPRTFIKHLHPSKPTTLNPASFDRKTLTTTAHFETLTPRQKQQIHLYVETLLQWNQESEVMERHIEDSLAIIPPIQSTYLSHYESLKLVDVGSGAGLPGLVLAIACPGWNVTLMESMNKRCVFLEHMVGVAGLSNVEVLPIVQTPDSLPSSSRIAVIDGCCGMVEGCDGGQNLGQDFGFREAFDVAVARAVAEMRTLAEYCLPLVRVGGLFVAAKGHDPQQTVGQSPLTELCLWLSEAMADSLLAVWAFSIQEEVRRAQRAINLMGASFVQTFSVESHSPYGQRTAIICHKDGSTPRKYPRDPGTPAKLP
ncbi:hypothetical protein RJ639_037619, partial [Escallonia herrerae]